MMKTYLIELDDDEVLVALKRDVDYEGVHPELVSEDAIGEHWPEYRTIHGDALLAGVKESLTATTGVPTATTGADCVTTGAAPAVPQGWMPIESAPKDGTLIVVMGNNHGDSELGQHHCIAIWHRGCWMESSDWNATSELEHLTHWMPLPQPPKDQTLQWCNYCGEGVTTFCRGRTDNCPRGLPLPGKEQT